MCGTGENTKVSFGRWASAKSMRRTDCLMLRASLFAAKVPCTKCKKLFNNTWFLHVHELRAHSGERRMRRLPCPRGGCEKLFTCRFNLDSHILGDHEGKRPFSCAVAGCNKSFAMKVNLNSDLRHVSEATTE